MLTIIITTFNRPQYLYRLLRHLHWYKVGYPIFVGDASEEIHLERNKKIIDSMSGVLDIHHLVYDSSSDVFKVMYPCLEQVDTRCVVFVADDDLIVPSTFDSVIEFMDSNRSYEAAQGRQILFTTASDGPYSASVKTESQKMVDFSVEGTKAIDRIFKRMSQDTRLSAPKTAYSIMRTSNALRLYKEVLSLGLNYSYNEATMNQMLLLSGNIKLLDKQLYIARQNHSSNAALRAFSGYVPIITRSSTSEPYEVLIDRCLEEKRMYPPDYFDQIIDPLFPIQYERMTTCLANELARNDGISVEEARRIIKYWQWYFIAKNMMPKFYEHGGADYQKKGVGFKTKSALKRFRQWAKGIPFLKKMWWKVSGGEMSLSSLLRPTSPYHKDFMPLYKIITTPPDDMNKNINEQKV